MKFMLFTNPHVLQTCMIFFSTEQKEDISENVGFDSGEH